MTFRLKAVTNLFFSMLMVFMAACSASPTPPVTIAVTQLPIQPSSTAAFTATLMETATALLPMQTQPPTPTFKPTLGIGSTQTSSKDGMLLVYVPAGNFLMGSDKSVDPLANSNELPQHTVTLDAFWIDQTPVTNAMYALCVTAGACSTPPGTSSRTHTSYYGNNQFADYPIINLDWQHANTYCLWAGQQLPTEAQYEKASRGTDGQIYPWGNQAPDKTLANYLATVGDTTKVGSYPAGASPYGALDMAGNVYEWVADWYSDTYYANSPTINPTGPSSGNYHALHGGSWIVKASALRSALRIYLTPNDGYFDIGFRCATSG